MDLVSALQSAFARNDLKVVPVSAGAPTLAKELDDSRTKLTDVDNITTGRAR